MLKHSLTTPQHVLLRALTDGLPALSPTSVRPGVFILTTTTTTTTTITILITILIAIIAIITKQTDLFANPSRKQRPSAWSPAASAPAGRAAPQEPGGWGVAGATPEPN